MTEAVTDTTSTVVWFGVPAEDTRRAQQEIPGVGLYARCADTEGNPFGLYQDGAK